MEQTLLNVRFPAGVSPQQVDDFPPRTPRSCEGSLHIRPNSTKKITPAELAHLEKKGIGHQVLRRCVPEPAPSQPRAAVGSMPEPQTPAPASAPPMSRKKRKAVAQDKQE